MNTREKYEIFYRSSMENREEFWKEQARLIDWETPFTRVLDYHTPPFAHWYPDATLNLCHNTVDRHLAERGDQNALIWVSTEVEKTLEITYRQLHAWVNQAAAVFMQMGVTRGDRILIYMPMIPQAVVAMLACVRIGAIHSVVFGGFAAHALASRINDATPKLIVTADTGMRGGKIVAYKPLLQASFHQVKVAKPKVLIVHRGLVPAAPLGPDEWDWDREMDRNLHAQIPPVAVPSNHPSYILYTSGTTGTPKGVQRDTGGHAVSMRASMKHIYDLRPGEVMLTGSDIGWVVGHSYIVYAPLLTGATTILYEGLPIRPDPGIWWSIVEKFKVNIMFTSPTAIRLLKKTGADWIHRYNLSSLRYLFLAGEPLDRETHRWIASTLKGQVIDNYWQTETGWPILANHAGLGLMDIKFGSPTVPAYGFDVHLVDEITGEPVKANEKGSLMIKPPLPPGCMTTVWGNDQRFVDTYYSRFKTLMYATFDYAMRDDDGYYFIMGRDDDVINVAGHRLGTREIEEILCTHPSVAEAAAVGVKDELKGQEVVAFVVVSKEGKPPGEQELKDLVSHEIGAIARPRDIYMVAGLPKTRSGKVLRRSIQAMAEGRDPGDLPTIDDAAVLDQIKEAIENK
ncbi:MAG: propionyl-CoA synthetase [Magnetococcales bacterium]|nr:propionyl-CoA synthetase [Magnetococcales bacterium]HIJ84032.1 propionate--CoA ligase [Magnetococcales bacterium]